MYIYICNKKVSNKQRTGIQFEQAQNQERVSEHCLVLVMLPRLSPGLQATFLSLCKCKE